METPGSVEKHGRERDAVYASSSTGEVEKRPSWSYMKDYFTSREGWIGDYVSFPTEEELFPD